VNRSVLNGHCQETGRLQTIVLGSVGGNARDNVKFAAIGRLPLTLGWKFVHILTHLICNSQTSQAHASGIQMPFNLHSEPNTAKISTPRRRVVL